MTHKCVKSWFIIDSDNDVSPDQRQAIIRIDIGVLSFGPRNKLKWKFDRVSYLFNQENTFENIVCTFLANFLVTNVLHADDAIR